MSPVLFDAAEFGAACLCTVFVTPILRLWVGIEGMDDLLLLFTSTTSCDWGHDTKDSGKSGDCVVGVCMHSFKYSVGIALYMVVVKKERSKLSKN